MGISYAMNPDAFTFFGESVPIQPWQVVGYGAVSPYKFMCYNR